MILQCFVSLNAIDYMSGGSVCGFLESVWLGWTSLGSLD